MCLLAALGALAVALASSACGPGRATGTSAESSTSPGSTSADGYHADQTTYQITQPIGDVQLDARAGRITVSAAEGPISITETYSYSDDKPPTSHEVVGDTLKLSAQGCQHERAINGRCEVDWDIKAPAATNLDLNNRAGAIAVTGAAGTLALQTNAGGIRARELVSKAVTVRTNAGGVDLRFAQPPGQLRASSDAGGIDIRLPAGTSYAVTATSNTGRPDISVQRSASSAHKIDAETNAGGIQISNG